MKRLSVEDKLFAILLLLATIVRFYNYAGWSLSNDELSAMSRLHFTSFSEMIEKGVKLDDMHPMGVQTFLWFWTKYFGEGVAVYRFPFVLMGSLSVLFFYLIAAKWFNKSSALVASVFFSFLQFPILYSQLARPYSPGLLFSLITVYAWTSLIFNKEKEDGNAKKMFRYLLFILSVTATMYVHYFAFLFSAIVAVTGLFFIPKKELKWYLLSGVIIFALYIPNYNVFIYQFSIGGLGGPDGWLGPPKPNALLTFIGYSLNDSVLVWIFSGLLFIVSAFLFFRKKGFTKFHLFTLIFSFLPAIIAYFYSILKNPVFQYSILIFGFPFLIMFICSYIPELKWKFKQISFLTFIGIIILYSTAVEQKFYTTQHFGVFKELVEKTIYYDSIYGEKNVIKTCNVISPFYINYYLKDNSSKIKYLMYSCIKSNDFIQMEKLCDSLKNESPYFLHSWSNTYHAPEVEQIIRKYYPYLAGRDSFFNSGVIVYSRLPVKNIVDYRHEIIKYKYGFEENKWINDSLCSVIDNSHEGNHVSKVDSTIEYGATYKTTVWNNCKGSTVELELWVKMKQMPKNISLVFTVERDGKSVLWRNVGFKDYVNVLNEWKIIYLSVPITDDVKPNDNVSIYVWNPDKENAVIDDFKYVVWN